jgi:hypothetical protein
MSDILDFEEEDLRQSVAPALAPSGPSTAGAELRLTPPATRPTSPVSFGFTHPLTLFMPFSIYLFFLEGALPYGPCVIFLIWYPNRGSSVLRMG